MLTIRVWIIKESAIVAPAIPYNTVTPRITRFLSSWNNTHAVFGSTDISTLFWGIDFLDPTIETKTSKSL
jgi:hypothetical protein